MADVDKETGMIPRLVPGFRVESLQLSPAEGFILSRLDGRSDQRAICAMTGLAPAQVSTCLEALVAAGAVTMSMPELRPPKARQSAVVSPAPSSASSVVAIRDADDEKRRRLEQRRQEIEEKRRSTTPKKIVSTGGGGHRAGQIDDKEARAKELGELGLAELREGHEKSAIANLKLASTVSEKNRSYYEGLIHDIQTQGVITRAQDLVNQGRKDLDMGFTEAAANHFAQASDLLPTKTTYATMAAEAFLECNSLEDAADYAELAVGLAPNLKDVRMTAARVQIARGESKVAKTHLEAIVKNGDGDEYVDHILDQLHKSAV